MRFKGEFIGHRHVCNTQRFGLAIALSGFPLRWAVCLLEWLLFWMRSMEDTNCIIHVMQASNGSNERWAPFCYWQGRLREELCTITTESLLDHAVLRLKRSRGSLEACPEGWRCLNRCSEVQIPGETSLWKRKSSGSGNTLHELSLLNILFCPDLKCFCESF